MAEIKTPKRVNVSGSWAYEISTAEATHLFPGPVCRYCPVTDVCNPNYESICSEGTVFVREDTWHRMKLQNS